MNERSSHAAPPMSPLRRVMAPLASLRLTVVLLALSMVLVFAGTLAQTRAGVWTVVHDYFRSPLVIIPIHIFLPERADPPRFAFPFPGGLTLGALLFINLLAAHITRFKMGWKRAGITVAHAGVLLLLVGEFVTGALAREGTMSITEGSYSNWVQDVRTPELAIIDPSDSALDHVTVIPGTRLTQGADIADPRLPVRVKVLEWMPNSRILPPKDSTPTQRARVTAGAALGLAAIPVRAVTGVDQANVDVPSAYIALSAEGKDLGTYLVSAFFDARQDVVVGTKTYAIQLRFTRTYKPYRIELVDFKHDRYVGTNTPKNFSSLVRLVDPDRHVERTSLISMNSPLRYAGETFYQASFKEGDTTTVLQVVDNPGWILPYVSCALVTVGLLAHFLIRLAGPVRRLRP